MPISIFLKTKKPSKIESFINRFDLRIPTIFIRKIRAFCYVLKILTWCNSNLEDYTGGSRGKNLHVKLRGVNTFLTIIIVVINR